MSHVKVRNDDNPRAGRVSVRVSGDAQAAFQALAARLGIKPSQLHRQAISDLFERHGIDVEV
jgi:predicted transcriptional regulator